MNLQPHFVPLVISLTLSCCLHSLFMICFCIYSLRLIKYLWIPVCGSIPLILNNNPSLFLAFAWLLYKSLFKAICAINQLSVWGYLAHGLDFDGFSCLKSQYCKNIKTFFFFQSNLEKFRLLPCHLIPLSNEALPGHFNASERGSTCTC